jgi:hypothetical protein
VCRQYGTMNKILRIYFMVKILFCYNIYFIRSVWRIGGKRPLNLLGRVTLSFLGWEKGEGERLV